MGKSFLMSVLLSLMILIGAGRCYGEDMSPRDEVIVLAASHLGHLPPTILRAHLPHFPSFLCFVPSLAMVP